MTSIKINGTNVTTIEALTEEEIKQRNSIKYQISVLKDNLYRIDTQLDIRANQVIQTRRALRGKGSHGWPEEVNIEGDVVVVDMKWSHTNFGSERWKERFPINYLYDENIQQILLDEYNEELEAERIKKEEEHKARQLKIEELEKAKLIELQNKYPELKN